MDSAAEGIFPRRTRCGWYNGVYYDCRSGWYHWGRWVLAGAALLVFFLVLLSCCCLARRRRKRGVTPYYGTGWMAPNGGKFGGTTQTYPMNGHQTGYYNNNDGGQYYAGGTNPDYGAGDGATYNPPPAYGVSSQDPQYAGNDTSPNNGYFGNTQYNSGPQPPPNAYQRDNVYPPPPAPPGGK